MKILISEDDDVSRKTLVKGLQKQGFEVIETTNGEQAWQKMLEPDAPKLLVLDIMMPEMDGLELCKKVRSYYKREQPYIIMLTAMTEQADVVYGLEEAGADDYITKPYNFDELRARISVGKRMLEMQSRLLAEITDKEKTQERLRHVNDEYEQVFNGTQDAMFLISVEDAESFRFIRNNETHQAATGISLEAIRDKTPEQLLGEEAGKEVVQNYINCVKAGKPIFYEEDLDLPKGKRTWATTLTPVLKNSKIQYIVGSSQDITERKQAEGRLRYLATTDELTGMWNRRHFTQATRDELERGQRYQQIFSLLMLDIDHFKRINDTYGHGAGDTVLQHIANLIRQSLRQVDIPGRFGGEEFAIILPHTDQDAAYVTAERLRQYIENTPAVYNNIQIPFSVSIGVATYQEDIENEDEIYKRADDALYEAKRKGRNITLTHNSQSSSSIND